MSEGNSQAFDKDSVRRIDSVNEHEVAIGFRVKPVPPAIQAALKDEEVEPPKYIRLSRVNPARRRFINEAVQRRYHKDLLNNDILSNAQVLEIVQKRGEWSPEKSRRMEQLQEKTTKEMAELWSEGLTPETTSFIDAVMNGLVKIHEAIDKMEAPDEEKVQIKAQLSRWASWSPRVKENFPADYDAGLEYSKIFDNLPVDQLDLLQEMEKNKEKQERLIELTEQRVELAELNLKHARIFADTAESRRDHTEELAQLYWTCERCDEKGHITGKLAADFDALWSWPDAAIKWLLYEAYFFHNQVPDVAREYLSAFGFFREERVPTENAASDASPALESSKLDGAQSEATPADSGVSPAVTNSTTPS